MDCKSNEQDPRLTYAGMERTKGFKKSSVIFNPHEVKTLKTLLSGARE